MGQHHDTKNSDEHAYVQLITKLLCIEFDSIWQRHKRLMAQKCAAWLIGAIAVLAALLGVWANNQPVDVRVSLNETSVHNDNLPALKNAVVSITLDNEMKTDTIPTVDIPALFANIPHKALGKDARITVSCQNWLPVDTTVVLSNDVAVSVARDPHPYGDIRFRLWNVNKETTYPNTLVTIDGHEATSDSDGVITFFMPLAEQDTMYTIFASQPLVKGTLHMPTTGSQIIEVK